MVTRRLLTSALVWCLAASLGAAEDADSLLRKVDATRNAFEETIITARASQVVEGRVTGSADFDIYRKGDDRALIVFRGGKNNGRKILTSGTRMWLLVPGARNAVPITANQRLMGGASIGDVARLRFAQDYQASSKGETEEIQGRLCEVLELQARTPKVSYPRVRLSVDAEAGLPCKAVFSLASGKAAREVVFTKFGNSGGRTVVEEMVVRDLLVPASRAVTRLEYRKYRSARIDDAIFTPEGARGL
jgi:hypothetical protein